MLVINSMLTMSERSQDYGTEMDDSSSDKDPFPPQPQTFLCPSSPVDVQPSSYNETYLLINDSSAIKADPEGDRILL